MLYEVFWRGDLCLFFYLLVYDIVDYLMGNKIYCLWGFDDIYSFLYIF